MKNFYRQSSLERRRPDNEGTKTFGRGINRWISMNDLEMTEGVWLRKMRQILFPPESRPPFPTHISQLLPHLFIGNQNNADNLEGLLDLGINHVINCAPSRKKANPLASPYPPDKIKYLAVMAEDKEDYDISIHFRETSSFIERAKQNKGKVFVHCNMGINRSSSVAVAYLVVEAKMDLLDAVSLLKKKRGICLTNRSFRRQLVKYAVEMGAVQGLPQRCKGPDFFGSRYDNLDSPSSVADDEDEDSGKTNKGGSVGVHFNQSDMKDDSVSNRTVINELPRKKQQIFTFTPTLNRNSCFAFEERKASLDLYDNAPFFDDSKINQEESFVHTGEKNLKNNGKSDAHDSKEERKKDVFTDKTTLENNEFSRHHNSHNHTINTNKENLSLNKDVINKPLQNNSKNEAKEVFHSELQYNINRKRGERKNLSECTEQNSSFEAYENVKTSPINYSLSDDFSNINLSSTPSNEQFLWQRKERETRRLLNRPFNNNHNSHDLNILNKNTLENTLFTNQNDTKNNSDYELCTKGSSVAGQSSNDTKTSRSSNYSIPHIMENNINTRVISNEFKSYTLGSDEQKKNDNVLKGMHHYNSNVNKIHFGCNQNNLENLPIHSENPLKNSKKDENLSSIKNNHFIKNVNSFVTSVKPEISSQAIDGVNYSLITDISSNSLSGEKAHIRNNPTRIRRFDNRSSLIVEKTPYPVIYRNSQAYDEISDNIRRITGLETPPTTTVSYSNVFNISNRNSYNENLHNNVVYIHCFNNPSFKQNHLNESITSQGKSFVEEERKKSNVQQMNLNSFYPSQPAITNIERFNKVKEENNADQQTNQISNQLRKLSTVRTNTFYNSSPASPNVSKPPLLRKVIKPTSPLRQPMQFLPKNSQDIHPFPRQNPQFQTAQSNPIFPQNHPNNPPKFRSSFLSSNSFSIPIYFRPSITTYEDGAKNITTSAHPSNKTTLRRSSSLKIQPKTSKNEPQTSLNTDDFMNDYRRDFIKNVDTRENLAPKRTEKQYHCLRVVQDENNDNRHSLIITGFHNNFLHR